MSILAAISLASGTAIDVSAGRWYPSAICQRLADAFAKGSSHGTRGCRTCSRNHATEERSSIFITLHGIEGFLFGAGLGCIALTVAVVQIAAWRRDRRLVRFLPQSLGATTAAFLTALWLVLAAEYRWIPGERLDTVSPYIVLAALAWIYRNRLNSARNRRELDGQ